MNRLSRRAKDIEASLIRQMFNYAAEVPEHVSLGVGIPPFPLPDYVRERFAEEIQRNPDINKYTLGKGLPVLNQAVARRLQEKGVYVDPGTEVLTTAGSAGGIYCTIMAIVDPNDDVIIPSPAYSNHVEVVRFAGGNPIYVPLVEDKGWRLDIDAIERAITDNAKAIVITNPSNPTGAVFPEEDLRAIGEIARRRNLYVLEDDAYDFLTYDGRRHFSLASVPELRENVVAFFTASKEHAMTGGRVGWVVGPKSIIDKDFDIQDETYICPPSFSQFAALIALTGSQDHVEYFRQEFLKRRNAISSRLDRLNDFVDYQKPQGAYYVFPRLQQPLLQDSSKLKGDVAGRWERISERFRTKDTRLALRLLYEAGVVTVPGISFGPQGENHLRLSFAPEEKVIHEAFDRIERWLVTV